DDGEPFTVFRHSDVRRNTRQGYGFVEYPAFGVAEKYGDRLTGAVARIPDVARSFRHPARRIGGIGRRRPDDRMDVSLRVDEGEAVRAVGWSETQSVTPEGRAQRRVVRIARKCNRGDGTAECTPARKAHLLYRARSEGDGTPGLADGNLRGGWVRQMHDRSVRKTRRPGVALHAIRARHEKLTVGERHGIGLQTSGYELDLPPDLDEVPVSHELADIARSIIRHGAEVVSHLKDTGIPARAAAPTRGQSLHQ